MKSQDSLQRLFNVKHNKFTKEEIKYLLLKFDESPIQKKKDILNTVRCDELRALAHALFNTHNKSIGNLKNDVIMYLVGLNKLPLIVDIINVHIISTYDYRVITNEHADNNTYAKMYRYNLNVPFHYINQEMINRSIYEWCYSGYSMISVKKIPYEYLNINLICFMLMICPCHEIKTLFVSIPNEFKTFDVCKLYIQKVGNKGIADIPTNLVNDIKNDKLCSISIKHILN